ncbi:cell division protein FtsW [Pelosinus fermentans]|uniref:FtsW/RodA/SpoVE family cell cycle protein n=1 Tax=Pelosinus fermentans TaxID=365349 RepID=UPI0002684B3A|nr:putative peptidoglycan glycosyltransferase FtsW [Pelosinus fermentans]OAM91997.1 cell cycle protein [Pelosinus fermentans DSM 17108]SDQ30451.1 cell division protein FtsW [Pelosinus fermentans]
MKLSQLWRSNAEAVICISMLLFMIGTVNIFSASFVEAGQQMGDGYYYLKRHLISFSIGIMAMLIISRIDYHRFNRFLFPFVLLTVGLLIAVHFIGIEVNGARRWLNIGFQFQPSELAKLTGLMITAGFLGPLIDRKRRISLLSTPFYIAAILGMIVLKQPDMGTAVIIVGISLMLYIIAGLPKQQLLTLVGGGIALFIYATFAASYRAERIAAWINPWDYQLGIGYQTVQGLLAIGSGGFWGTGLGMGSSKFNYLPEAHTDFAFAVLCQEMGFVGALGVLCLMGLLAYYGVRIALKAPDGLGKLLTMGSIFLIVGQAIINISMVSSIFPVVGVPLPFISFGGTSLIVNLMAIGLILNVGRQADDAVLQDTAPEPDASRSTRLKLARQARNLNRVK